MSLVSFPCAILIFECCIHVFVEQSHLISLSRVYLACVLVPLYSCSVVVCVLVLHRFSSIRKCLYIHMSLLVRFLYALNVFLGSKYGLHILKLYDWFFFFL